MSVEIRMAHAAPGARAGCTAAVQQSSLVASVFQLLAVHWHDHVLEPGDLRQHLAQHWVHRTSVFHLPEAPRLRQTLGRSPGQWGVASGASYLGGSPAKMLLAPHLRYCPECLAAGWHCALFQHIAARWCPLHRVPLRQGCPRCDKPIVLEPVSIATHQNFCPHCSFPFAPMDALRVRCETGPHEHAAFAGLAAALTRESAADSSALRSELTAHELLATDRTTLVACAAHSCCPAGLTPAVRWFAATRRTVAFGDALAIERVNDLAYAARVTAFENIQAWLEASGETLQVPAVLQLIETTRGAARISTAVDTCSAALARTAIGLQMHEVLPGARAPTTADRSSPYNKWLPMYEELVSEVAQSQVYALFVLNLVALRRCRQTADVAWNWRAHPATFSPPWRLRREANEDIFEMRARVDAQSLRRFVRRYARRRLLSVGAALS